MSIFGKKQMKKAEEYQLNSKNETKEASTNLAKTNASNQNQKIVKEKKKNIELEK